ncbi:glycosyltransferase [Candidatus Gracilibacteria bacterium]|nr:glycosyltransferase [Candidatus Gracilibacteria bacterium]
MQKKKFISIIWGYHKQIFTFDRKENYHILPLEAMREEGFECEIFSIDSSVVIENDPNFIEGVKVIYYKSFIQYLLFLWKNRNSIIYSNSLTIKTLLVGLIGNNTIFHAHDQVIPIESKILKKWIVLFFYRFFSLIRVINPGESSLLSKFGIKSKVVPLVISENFFSENQARSDLVFIGNLYFDKNPEFLLFAMQLLIIKYPDIKLHIFGEDRYKKNGKDFSCIVKDMGLSNNVIIHGFIPHGQLLKELSLRMIYINTSISEGQCLTAYEAALSGCFLCLQDILAFPSVFNDNALYHSTYIELANNIEYIIENAATLRVSILNNQKMILSKYNYDYLKGETKNLFLNINS